MRNREEIESNLTDLYHKRLSLRYKKYLSRDSFNCAYNERCELNNGVSGSRIGCCKNIKNIKNDKIFICNDRKQAVKCQYYVCINNKADIEQQFLKDISDPKICGQKEPKIAVMLWILQSTEKKLKIEKRGLFTNIWKKIFFWKVDGLV